MSGGDGRKAARPAGTRRFWSDRRLMQDAIGPVGTPPSRSGPAQLGAGEWRPTVQPTLRDLGAQRSRPGPEGPRRRPPREMDQLHISMRPYHKPRRAPRDRRRLSASATTSYAHAAAATRDGTAIANPVGSTPHCGDASASSPVTYRRDHGFGFRNSAPATSP